MNVTAVRFASPLTWEAPLRASGGSSGDSFVPSDAAQPQPVTIQPSKPLRRLPEVGAIRMPLPEPESGDALTKLENNFSMAGVSGNVRVIGAEGIPQASAVARAVGRMLALTPESVTEIVLVDSLSELPAETPSGVAQRYTGPQAVVDQDGDYRRVYVQRGFQRLDPNLSGPVEVTVGKREDPALGALLPEKPGVYVGGLISISAEPPEGFFAASTAAELQQAGFPVGGAEASPVWLLRVPDSRDSSYFEFGYPSADRPSDTPREGKFKIAAGVGPASNPLSTGGAEADLLWLGDEQHGGLQSYLELLARPDLRLSDLYGQQGLIQKLPDGSVFLGSPDRAHALTKQGFDALVTDPTLYRRVYSEDYDRFLATLFEPVDEPAKATYLLATSRGCTQGCTLCAAGGLKTFQSLSGPRMMEELEKLARHSDLGPGEKLDVFFVDSNFNNNPNRLIEFAQLYRESPLYGQFRFFIRHNTVKGFLKGDHSPNHELIGAFKTLGVKEVWMGVDTYDDASTLTLKSNRLQLAKKEDQARPTYTFEELTELIRAFERNGLTTKGFYLANNPWVGDLDRLDSYYNLMQLWLENPHFSIDSRERGVNQLKPFAGSPIQQITDKLGLDVVSEGRFRTRGLLGELDELVDVRSLGQPRARGGAEEALESFRRDLGTIRRGAESKGGPEGELILRKMLQRDALFRPVLERESSAAALALLQEMDEFATRHAGLPPFDPEEQKARFRQASKSLFEGLRELDPIRLRL